MRLTLAALSLAILLDACRIDAPPAPSPPSPSKDELAPRATPGGPSGGQFFCRTDRGEMRELLSRKVIASLLQSSTVGSARVENCTVQARRRWEFPKTLDGGSATVTYPFERSPLSSVSIGRPIPRASPG